MLFRLVRAYAVRPILGLRTFRALQAYRGAQEDLRDSSTGDTAVAQLQLASDRTGLPRDFVARTVERWMEQEPLPLLRGYMQPGVEAFLSACQDAGIALAALSDYPPDAKLEAMGLKVFIGATFCAQNPNIGVFKPDPKGIRVALELLGVPANRAIYVGDRVDVDAVAAHAAGIACAILTRQPAAPTDKHVRVASFAELTVRLFGPETNGSA